jgi:hypothetical protein
MSKQYRLAIAGTQKDNKRKMILIRSTIIIKNKTLRKENPKKVIVRFIFYFGT